MSTRHDYRPSNLQTKTSPKLATVFYKNEGDKKSEHEMSYPMHLLPTN